MDTYVKRMKVGKCDLQPILRPCTLEGIAHQLDPYIGCAHRCAYCYAVNSKSETNRILVYHHLHDQLERELAAISPQTVYIGWASDPYQPAEGIHQQTREVLQLLAECRFSVCILTKSDIIVRDIDLLKSMPGSSVGFSMAFHDEAVRELFEAFAPSNQRRLKALKTLKEAGLETYVLVCPVMPFTTDVDRVIEMVAPYSDTIWVYPLQVEGEESLNWRRIQDVLDYYFPGLSGRYREIVFSEGKHPYWKEVREKLEQYSDRYHLNLRIEI